MLRSLRNKLWLNPISCRYYGTRIERFDGQIENEKQRRRKLASLLPSDSMTIISAARTLYMTNDIPYPFRQNSNFYYLTGFEEPDAILLIDKKDSVETTKFILFVLPKDIEKERWHGIRVGWENAHEYGSSESYPLTSFSNYFNSKIYEKNVLIVDEKPAQLDSVPNIPLQKAREYLDPLRFIKSPQEIELAKKAASISNIGFRAIMKSSYPGINEHLLNAELEWECRKNGAQRLAYPPVVAGGIRANTLHYITNDKPINDGELVLVDGGAELHCFCSDVSRTWPVNGKFTREQAQIYQIVLATLNECINECRRGTTINRIHSLSVNLLVQGLKSLGIINAHNNDYMKYYPHCIGHYLGMDVHDTSSMSYNQKLQPGTIVTIEPGLYIPKDPNFNPKYHGIGIRIEDNILITDSEPINLTKSIPKEIDEIEYLVKTRKSE